MAASGRGSYADRDPSGLALPLAPPVTPIFGITLDVFKSISASRVQFSLNRSDWNRLAGTSTSSAGTAASSRSSTSSISTPAPSTSETLFHFFKPPTSVRGFFLVRSHQALPAHGRGPIRDSHDGLPQYAAKTQFPPNSPSTSPPPRRHGTVRWSCQNANKPTPRRMTPNAAVMTLSIRPIRHSPTAPFFGAASRSGCRPRPKRCSGTRR